MSRKTVFCVQRYAGSAKRLEPQQMRQFGTVEDALAYGGSVQRRSTGVVVFSVTGEPDFDAWEAPDVLAEYGMVPDIRF